MNFWWTLVLVNIGFFLPYYIINFRSQPNPFQFLTSPSVSFGNKIKAVYYKVSSDPFKVFYEFTLLILVGQYFNLDSSFFALLCTMVGVIGWVIILYSGIMKYVFLRSPIIRSDIEFLKIGWKMNYNNRQWILLAIITLITLSAWALYWVSSYMLNLSVGNTSLWIVGIVLSVLAFVKMRRIKYDRFIHRTVLSVFAYLFRNFNYSNRFNYLFDKDANYFKSLNAYRDLDLAEKPNIYLFSIESYGSVAYEDAEIRKEIIDICHDYQEKLSSKGYHQATRLSTAPVSGGGSWKCYTSFTYGMKVDDDLLYNILFKSLPAFENYDSLFHTFRNQGYRNYLLCPATNYIEGTVDWDLVQKNMQSDAYLTWERIDYKGKPVPFLGNCYGPPDQYSIHKAQQILEEEEKNPYVLFFSTLNSHYPYKSPTDLADDIGSLDVGNIDILQKNQLDSKPRYAKAIRYQLEVIFDFISKKGDGIFVLFGDHQPPMITGQQDGFETPIHVIAKNKTLVSSFRDNGFTHGLVPDLDNDSAMKHEGFYSLFMQAIYKTYDKHNLTTKSFLENGIELVE